MPPASKAPPSFPHYLLPPAPFRPASSNSPYLPNTHSTLHCQRCGAPLCPTSQIISKGFTGRHGRAYLVSPTASATGAAGLAATAPPLPNTHTHRPVARTLVTGAHTVSDISCRACAAVLGWKYVAAEEATQRYKVGMFILETRRVRCERVWEGVGEGREGEGEREAAGAEEFDSQDEEECEDLFAGVWTPQLARKRRRGRGLLREKKGGGSGASSSVSSSSASSSPVGSAGSAGSASRWGGGEREDFDHEHDLDEEEAEMSAMMV